MRLLNRMCIFGSNERCVCVRCSNAYSNDDDIYISLFYCCYFALFCSVAYEIQRKPAQIVNIVCVYQNKRLFLYGDRSTGAHMKQKKNWKTTNLKRRRRKTTNTEKPIRQSISIDSYWKKIIVCGRKFGTAKDLTEIGRKKNERIPLPWQSFSVKIFESQNFYGFLFLNRERERQSTSLEVVFRLLHCNRKGNDYFSETVGLFLAMRKSWNDYTHEIFVFLDWPWSVDRMSCTLVVHWNTHENCLVLEPLPLILCSLLGLNWMRNKQNRTDTHSWQKKRTWTSKNLIRWTCIYTHEGTKQW